MSPGFKPYICRIHLKYSLMVKVLAIMVFMLLIPGRIDPFPSFPFLFPILQASALLCTEEFLPVIEGRAPANCGNFERYYFRMPKKSYKGFLHFDLFYFPGFFWAVPRLEIPKPP